MVGGCWIRRIRILRFDAHGRLDLRAHQRQLHADVDHLESANYVPLDPTTVPASATEWHPDPFTRRALIAASRTPAWRPRPMLRVGVHDTAA